MRVRRKVSPHRIGRRNNARQVNVATMAIACLVLALAVDVLAPGADGASPAAVERRAPEARIDTAFVAVGEAPLAAVPPVAPQAQSRCGDFDFSFLKHCATAWKKPPARLHRPATFVAGIATAVPSGPQVSTKSAGVPAGPAKRPALAAATSPDRAPPATKKLKPAVTAALAAVIQ
jgi:hypothetical protein